MTLRNAPVTQDIHITTQVRENYGDAARPYWKSKGGRTVVLAGFSHPLSDGIAEAAAAAVAAHRATVEADNEYWHETIIDWALAPAGALTEDEKLQVEFEGRVSYPDARIAL